MRMAVVALARGTCQGTYPHLRYFAIAAYEVVGRQSGYTFEVGDPLYDAEINPDQGTNPFVRPGGSDGTYTVEISRGDFQTAARARAVPKGVLPNTITVTADLVWIVLRAYVPGADSSLTGQSLMGGVPLPAITLTEYNGVSKKLETCSPINKWSDLIALALLTRHVDTPVYALRLNWRRRVSSAAKPMQINDQTQATIA